MKILNLLSKLNSSRRAGYTTLLMEGAKNYKKPFDIIADNQTYAEELAERSGNPNANPLSINADNKFKGNHNPFVLDNEVLINVLQEVANKHDQLKRELLKAKNEKHNAERSRFNAECRFHDLANSTLIERIFKWKELTKANRLK